MIHACGEVDLAQRAGRNLGVVVVHPSLDRAIGDKVFGAGEHGVGIEKRELMRFQYAQEDLEQQMRVRNVFDPHWLMNPAKVFPLEGRLVA